MSAGEPNFKTQGLELTIESDIEMRIHLYGGLEFYDREEMKALRDFLDTWLKE